MDHHSIYISHIDAPYGDHYAAMVGRFQEGFLRDNVCRDLDRAFEKAVETCEALIGAIKIKAAS